LGGVGDKGDGKPSPYRFCSAGVPTRVFACTRTIAGEDTRAATSGRRGPPPADNSAWQYRKSLFFWHFCRGTPWGARGQGKPSPCKACLVAAMPHYTTRSFAHYAGPRRAIARRQPLVRTLACER